MLARPQPRKPGYRRGCLRSGMVGFHEHCAHMPSVRQRAHRRDQLIAHARHQEAPKAPLAVGDPKRWPYRAPESSRAAWTSFCSTSRVHGQIRGDGGGRSLTALSARGSGVGPLLPAHIGRTLALRCAPTTGSGCRLRSSSSCSRAGDRDHEARDANTAGAVFTSIVVLVPTDPRSVSAHAVQRAIDLAASGRRLQIVSAYEPVSDEPPGRGRSALAACSGCINPHDDVIAVTPPRPGRLGSWGQAGYVPARATPARSSTSPRSSLRPDRRRQQGHDRSQATLPARIGADKVSHRRMCSVLIVRTT